MFYTRSPASVSNVLFYVKVQRDVGNLKLFHAPNKFLFKSLERLHLTPVCDGKMFTVNFCVYELEDMIFNYGILVYVSNAVRQIAAFI